jgi:uncharacterized protein (DUF2225 family)
LLKKAGILPIASTDPKAPTGGGPLNRILEISLVCPLCREPFRSSVPGGSADPGPLHTDFRREAVGFQPRSHLIHTCPFCGFTGQVPDYERDVPRSLARRMIHSLRYIVRGDVPLTSQRYEYAALCSEMLGDDPSRTGEYYLAAAWSASEEGQEAEETRHRRKAARCFERALATPDTVPACERAVTAYLIGELYRRLGSADEANAWLGRVAHEIIDRRTQGWILSLADQQRCRPREIIDLPKAPDRA